MNENRNSGAHPLRGRTACTQTRLAESSVAVVDLCSCGTLQVHIGPMTVRLAASALDELQNTLARAAEAHAATCAENAGAAFFNGRGGQA